MIKNGKLFGKINLFDFIVLLLVLVLIVGIGYKFLVLDKEKASNMVEVTYELKIETVRDVTVNAFEKAKEKGHSLYQYTSEDILGTVTGVNSVEAMDPMDNLTGQTVLAPVVDRYDLTVTVKGTAVRQEDGTLMMGKTKLVEGGELRVATQLAHCIAKVQNVQCN